MITLKTLVAFAFGGFISFIGFPFYKWQFWVLLLLFIAYDLLDKDYWN